jgi:hypothetical protein
MDKLPNGYSKHPLYKRWSGIKQRLYNKKDKSYKNYGARGIKLCEEWHDFKNFYNWSINNGFDVNLEIDRIDGSIGYCPENCRWVSEAVNLQNIGTRHVVNIGRYVYTKPNGFEVHVVKNDKSFYVGEYKTIEEARLKSEEFYLKIE